MNIVLRLPSPWMFQVILLHKVWSSSEYSFGETFYDGRIAAQVVFLWDFWGTAWGE